MRLIVLLISVLLLAPALSAALTMQGYVFSTDGGWIEGARIRCSNSANDYVATSGTDGYYSIQGMEKGKYTCSASKNGFESAYREVDLQIDYQRIDFHLRPLPFGFGILKGHVFSGTQPKAGAVVKCGEYVTTSDIDGYYEMVLPAGRHVCSADNQAHSYVVVPDGGEAIHNFYLQEGAGESGKIRIYGEAMLDGNPADGIRVECNGRVSYSSSGWYEVLVSPGWVSCIFSYPGYASEYWSGYAASDTRVDVNLERGTAIYGIVTGGGIPLDGARVECNGMVDFTVSGRYRIPVSPGFVSCSFEKEGYRTEYWSGFVFGEVEVNVDLAPELPRVYGRVYDDAGGVVGVKVTCDGRTDYTDQFGNYEVPVSPGWTECTFEKPGYETKHWSGYVFHDTRVDIFLGKEQAIIYGYVTENGKGISGVRVDCGRTAYTSSSGYYEIAVSPGWISCTFSHPSYFTETWSGWASGRTRVDLELERKGFRIDGMVRFNGIPVSGARVICDGKTAYTSSGRFSFSGMYGRIACTAEYNGVGQTKIVDAYRDVWLEFDLSSLAKLSGKVVDENGFGITGAKVACDGRTAHSNPYWEMMLPSGKTYTCYVSKAGFKEKAFTVFLSGDREVEVILERIDRTPPSLSVSAYAEEKVVIEAWASDESGIEEIVISRGLRRKVCKSSYCRLEEDLPAGRYDYTISAKDRYGNTASRQVSVAKGGSTGIKKEIVITGRYLQAERAERRGWLGSILGLPLWKILLLAALLAVMLVLLAMLLSSERR